MNKKQVIRLINKSPVFYLGTVEDSYPRVRGMLLYKADESGIVFHTASIKDLYKQVIKNPKAELCFNCENGLQIRVSGDLIEVNDKDLKDEIIEHPTREFLRKWRDSGELKDIYNDLIVIKLIYNVATIWTVEKNFEEKEVINMK